MLVYWERYPPLRSTLFSRSRRCSLPRSRLCVRVFMLTNLLFLFLMILSRVPFFPQRCRWINLGIHPIRIQWVSSSALEITGDVFYTKGSLQCKSDPLGKIFFWCLHRGICLYSCITIPTKGHHNGLKHCNVEWLHGVKGVWWNFENVQLHLSLSWTPH